MLTDIVLPDGNEKEFADMAVRLGYTKVILAYPFGKVPKAMLKASKVEIEIAELVGPKDLTRLQNRKHMVIAKSTGDDRGLFESKDIDMIYGLEIVSKKDFIHHRASGLNQVLAKLAHERDIMIGIAVSDLIRKKDARHLARIMQNIRFCRKYGIRMIAASFAKNPMHMRSPKDMQAFMLSLGADPDAAKKSVEF